MWRTTSESRPNPSGQGSGSVVDDAETLLYRAALEARAGHHAAALTLLDRLAQAGDPPNPAALDLRARIFAQLGLALAAERLWTAATQAEPDNTLYPLALARLRDARRPGSRLGTIFAIVGAGAMLLWILGQGLQIGTVISDLRAQLAVADASAQGAMGETRRDIADLRTDTRQSFGEVRASVSATKAQLTTSDESVHGEIGALRQGIEALRADTDQALRGVQATIRDLSERMTARADMADGELNAVRRDMESARGETREALGEVRTAIVGLVNQFDANPVQRAAQAGSAAPAPTQPQKTDTQVADPDALSTPAGDAPEGMRP